jgi:GT2 family glycosyltransferase
MRTVDVVIPTHNSVHWLAWCLEELFRFKSDSLQKCFVIDDHSSPDEAAKIREIVCQYPSVELTSVHGEEGGFGVACNLGATKGKSDIILFLNTDCLVTEGVIDRLADVFEDTKVALACPFSNNSSNLSYNILPGFSYQDMALLFSESAKESEIEQIVEACTIVGNCLMVRRDFFASVGGFSPEWGVGYGEETDLHMKALAQGLKGVVHLGCYVYHYGGGTFNYKIEIEAHREKNYQLFMSKWANEYRDLSSRCESLNPAEIIDKNLKNHLSKKDGLLEFDVLFYLPGVDQGIGGVNAVIAICNHLIRQGLKAGIALISGSTDQLKYYKDPVLFNFLYYDSNESFLNDDKVLTRVIFSTIVWSGPIVSEFAWERNAVAVQFVQGYEGFFWNGTKYPESIECYQSTKHLVTTSNWLANLVKRHLSDAQEIKQLPLIVNENIFFSGNSPRPIDVILVFRSSTDKGQWILAEILDRLASSGKSVTVLFAADYSSLKAKYENWVQFIELPLDQYSLAKILRQAKIFVDASLHEGYGLVPLEAALCGCNLVLSDSGGVRDFINNYKNEIIPNLLNPADIIKMIDQSLQDFTESKNVAPQNFTKNSGKLWYNYFQHLTENKELAYFQPEFLQRIKPIIEDAVIIEEVSGEVISTDTAGATDSQLPAEVSFTEINVVSDGRTKKFYKVFIFPYIPQRVHLALKVLLSGKI